MLSYGYSKLKTKCYSIVERKKIITTARFFTIIRNSRPFITRVSEGKNRVDISSCYMLCFPLEMNKFAYIQNRPTNFY